MIVGAQKCATTSLLRYLSQHPELSSHSTIECVYFADDAEWQCGWNEACRRYFYDATGNLLVAKSASLYTDDVYLDRLQSHNPECTVIMLLRDPVERAYSSYRMERSWAKEPFDHIANALNDPSDLWNRVFLQLGDYLSGLRRIYRCFDPAQVLVVFFEELVADPASCCREVFHCVGIDDSFVPNTVTVHNLNKAPRSEVAATALRWLRGQDNTIKRLVKRAIPPSKFDRLGQILVDANKGRVLKEDMTPQTRALLGKYYRKMNEELEDLLQRDLPNWTGIH